MVKETIGALKALSNKDNRLVIFEHASHSDSNGSFQIAACSESGDKLAMKMGAFHFSATQNVDHVLWYSFSSSNVNMYQGSQAMTLNDDVYSQVRSTIITKLGDNAAAFIGNLDI